MYDQYYELTGRPFQLTPDPRFYFESGTHRKALSYLGYGLAQGEGFIVITGEIGAGKTTLVRHLMETVDPGRLTAATIVTTQVEGKDLLHMVAESFGIAATGREKSDTLHAIEQFLHEEARHGRRCLLVVDEAQNLPTGTLEELRMLSNFQLGDQALLQIFLLGQPEFRDQLRDAPGLEQLRQRVIATHHLEAMQPEEMEPYIVHRLSKVGWTGRPDFTVAAIEALYAASGGVPRKLNMLMTRVLLMGAVEHVDRIDGDLIEDVLADMNGDADHQRAAYEQPFAQPEPVEVDGPEMPGDAPVEQAESDEPTAALQDAAEEYDDPEAMTADEEREASQIPETFGDADGSDTPETYEEQDEPEAETLRFFRPGVPPPSYDAEADLEQDFVSAPVDDVFDEERRESDPDAARGTIGEDQFAALVDRVDILEHRVEDQEATIRRLVALLLDYVEREDGLTHRRAA